MEISNIQPSLALLRQAPAFNHFNEKALEELTSLFISVTFQDDGSIPIRLGDSEPHLYLISSGSFDFNLLAPEKPSQVLIKLKQGELAGGFLFCASHRNQTSLTSDGSSLTFQVLRTDLNDFFDRNTTGVEHFHLITQTTFHQAQLSIFLSTNFMIRDPNVFDYFSGGVRWKRLKNGDALFKQGESGEVLYMVLSGRLKSVLQKPDGELVVSNIINAGQLSGEVAFLTHSDRIATVYAVRDSIIAEFSHTEFNQITEKHPQAMFHIAELLGNRLKFQSKKHTIDEEFKTYALMPAHQDYCLNAFARDLRNSMHDWGTIICITSEDIGAVLGIKVSSIDNTNSSQNSLISQWFEQQELIYDHVILVADRSWTNWNEKILNHSDHILIVANSEQDCEPTEHEKQIIETGRIAKHQKKSLILIHPDSSNPITGTRHWLNKRQLDDWYHIRSNTNEDMQRLGRLLTGNANALVLGGGGARGYAHIGVIQALAEHNVPIDRVCGTSIGAIISSGVALGYDRHALLNLCKKHFHKLLDYTLPIISLIKGQRIERKLNAAFNEQFIEDLVIPFFCISTNLTRAEQIVHTRGSLKEALRCSMSLPAVMPPVYKGGDLIVDGGLLNNLPIDEMHKRAGDCNIIASDISPKYDLTNSNPFSSSISGLKLFISRINPFQKSIETPGILNILERSITVAAVNYGIQVQEQNMADLYIELPVENISTLDYGNVEQTADLGYTASVKQIKQWARK